MIINKQLKFLLLLLSCTIGLPSVANALPSLNALASQQNKVADLFQAMITEVPYWADAPKVKQDYLQLVKQYSLKDDPVLYQDYVRIRMAFESTRAGGLWGIAWNITNQLPQSDNIWQQWQKSSLIKQSKLPITTAVAECDELSALVAVVAHGIGLSKNSSIGLFWPTSNHTVAVWTINNHLNIQAKPTRIIIPTSQIFLDVNQSLGTTTFNPWKQKNIYDYKRSDISKQAKLPAALIQSMIEAIHEHANVSQAELQIQRNAREQKQRQ